VRIKQQSLLLLAMGADPACCLWRLSLRIRTPGGAGGQRRLEPSQYYTLAQLNSSPGRHRLYLDMRERPVRRSAGAIGTMERWRGTSSSKDSWAISRIRIARITSQQRAQHRLLGYMIGSAGTGICRTAMVIPFFQRRTLLDYGRCGVFLRMGPEDTFFGIFRQRLRRDFG